MFCSSCKLEVTGSHRAWGSHRKSQEPGEVTGSLRKSQGLGKSQESQKESQQESQNESQQESQQESQKVLFFLGPPSPPIWCCFCSVSGCWLAAAWAGWFPILFGTMLMVACPLAALRHYQDSEPQPFQLWRCRNT